MRIPAGNQSQITVPTCAERGTSIMSPHVGVEATNTVFSLLSKCVEATNTVFSLLSKCARENFNQFCQSTIALNIKYPIMVTRHLNDTLIVGWGLQDI